MTLVISITFILALGWSELRAAIGLIGGGMLAAPLGGYIVARAGTRLLMIAVAAIIIISSGVRFL